MDFITIELGIKNHRGPTDFSFKYFFKKVKHSIYFYVIYRDFYLFKRKHKKQLQYRFDGRCP